MSIFYQLNYFNRMFWNYNEIFHNKNYSNRLQYSSNRSFVKLASKQSKEPTNKFKQIYYLIISTISFLCLLICRGMLICVMILDGPQHIEMSNMKSNLLLHPSDHLATRYMHISLIFRAMNLGFGVNCENGIGGREVNQLLIKNTSLSIPLYAGRIKIQYKSYLATGNVE